MTDYWHQQQPLWYVFCVCENWEKVSIGIQGFVTADREQTLCMCECMCVYNTVSVGPFSHYAQGWSAEWKVTMFTGLFVRCTSGGSQWPSHSHTHWMKSAGIQMYIGRKKKAVGLCFCLSLSLSPVYSLPVFTDLSMSFGSVGDILSSVSYRERVFWLCENQSRVLR